VIDELAAAFRQHPELALFLSLAIGHGVGQLKLGGFTLGPVLGTLLAGVIVGQWQIPVAASLKNAFFLLWLFAIGCGTGPLFFRGLRSTGLPQVALTLLLCGIAVGTAVAASAFLAFDPGTAGGMFAGAMTSSAAIGSVTDGLAKLALDRAATQTLAVHGTVAFAVSYLVGTALVIWLLSRVGPRLVGGDLAKACRSLEEEMGVVRRDPFVVSAYAEVVARAFTIPREFNGARVADLESAFTDARVFVERVSSERARPSGGDFVEAPAADFPLFAGDRVALSGRRETLVSDSNPLRAHEVDDRLLLDLPAVSLDVVMTQREVTDRTLGDLAKDLRSRGVFVRRLTRAGVELPFTLATRIERGDVLRLVGTKGNVTRMAKLSGHADWPTDATDLARVALTIVLGGLIGIPALRFGRLDIGLGVFVGVLLAGLVFGWACANRPRFGHIPPPALGLMESLGLTGFLALVGMEAGPDFLRGLSEAGPSLIAATVVVVTLAHVITILVGRYVMGLHPGILLGVCCGAGTSAPALAAVQEVADSKIPALGYGVACALGNVILAISGGVIVLMVGR
jgi:putative transport protein